MEVPRFCDYGISPVTGFLPEAQPLKRLPVEYEAWEAIVDKLPEHILNGTLRERIERMPLLQAGKLSSPRELQRACSVLGFLTHAYVWSPPEVNSRLPLQLSEPMIIVSERLGLPPVATYAGLCLWNFKSSSELWTLGSLETLQSYTNSQDEAWFFLVSVAMEKQGGPCLKNGLAALEACLRGDYAEIIEHLEQLKDDIEKLTVIMMRLSEKLDPAFFYNKLRPFLAGWRGMAKAGLPDGVYYGNETEARQYAGGSNGQSSLIQALDIILNVEHHALGHRQPPAPLSKAHAPSELASSVPFGNPYLKEMRNYMPREHREFLQALEKCAILRPFVLANGKVSPRLTESYDNCLKTLRTFRSRHIQIVMRYISLPARKHTQGMGLSGKGNGGDETGTGGTQLMPFLKQTRDEVGDAAAGDWSRFLLSSVPSK